MIRIRHLAASRRKHARAREGLAVESGGERLEVLDWSVGGVRVAALPRALPAGADVPLTVAGLVEGVRRTFETRARVARGDEGGVVLEFGSLSAAGRELLSSLSGGGAAPDTPEPEAAPPLREAERATLAPAPEPRPEAAPAEKKKGWRPPVRAVLYVAVGALLAAYIGEALYRRVWRIEVETAALIAPTARIVSPADGVVRGLEVAEGEVVKKGDILFGVASPRAEAALQEVEQAVAAAEVRVKELEAARAARRVQLDIHGDILKARIGGTGALVKALEDRVAIADARITRLVEVQAQGAVSGTEVDEVRALRAQLAGQLAQARAELSGEKRRLGAAREGYHFDGDGMSNGLPELDATLTAARAMLAVEQARLEAERVRVATSDAARAPFAGRVAEVLQTEGTPVRHGSLVLVLHREDDRLVEAWLSRRQAGYVRLGDPAVVEVPGLGRRYDGVVRSIGADPAAEEHAGDEPRLRALVEIGGYVGEPWTAETAAEELRVVDSVGLPAIVSFERSWR